MTNMMFKAKYIYYNQIFYRKNVEGYFSELLPKASPSRSSDTRNGNKGKATYDSGYLSTNNKEDIDTNTNQSEAVSGRQRII